MIVLQKVYYKVCGIEDVHIDQQNRLEIAVPYDENADTILHKPCPNYSTLRLIPGRFIVLYPTDAFRLAQAPTETEGSSKNIGILIAIPIEHLT